MFLTLSCCCTLTPLFVCLCVFVSVSPSSSTFWSECQFISHANDLKCISLFFSSLPSSLSPSSCSVIYREDVFMSGKGWKIEIFSTESGEIYLGWNAHVAVLRLVTATLLLLYRVWNVMSSYWGHREEVWVDVWAQTAKHPHVVRSMQKLRTETEKLSLCHFGSKHFTIFVWLKSQILKLLNTHPENARLFLPLSG